MLKVERGFSAHRTGAFVTPPQFNHDNCWRPLEDFLPNIDKVKEARWSSILRIQGSDEDEVDSDARADMSAISAFRAEMYIPSSPLKLEA